jgi:diaminohydroxyphosphoribosylaminopyrimidine deaminase/5-amino-6-(5-phosphoribosylamino)uracil reductase
VVDADLGYMRTALALAERGRGRTSPNPMVGAVIVSDGVIVGAGHHERAGTPHAEIHAIAAAGALARDATLYCSLEPCCHTGRTGPCAAAIAEAGIARVVAAVEDPNPLVAGGGFGYLRARGIDVRTGVLEDEARRQNEVFFTTIRRRRPFVTMKVAMSLDGRIAAARGARTAISGSAAIRHAQRVRAEVDAIGVGSETVLIDNPLLTARDVYRGRPLARVVFDTRLRIQPSAALFSTLEHGPVFVVTTQASVDGVPDRAASLERAGARLVVLPERAPGLAMDALWREGMASLLVEGGARLHGALWEAGLVDRMRWYVSMSALGADGVEWSVPAGCGVSSLQDVRVEVLDQHDVLIEGHVHRAR